jgi:RiboL-PSP-HEPN
MSKAKGLFDGSIKDAEDLLAHCQSLGHPLPQSAEVFKRAGLVMALTAWETYVEKRIMEAVWQRLPAEHTHAERFMLAKLDEELRRFHNPNAEKTRRLFLDYLGVDVTENWRWSGLGPVKVRDRLDTLVKKRGDAVHRGKGATGGAPAPHLVSKEELPPERGRRQVPVVAGCAPGSRSPLAGIGCSLSARSLCWPTSLVADLLANPGPSGL